MHRLLPLLLFWILQYMNTSSQDKMIHRYTWARGNERSLIDYIAVNNRLRREVEDAKVVRGMFSGSTILQ